MRVQCLLLVTAGLLYSGCSDHPDLKAITVSYDYVSDGCSYPNIGNWYMDWNGEHRHLDSRSWYVYQTLISQEWVNHLLRVLGIMTGEWVVWGVGGR